MSCRNEHRNKEKSYIWDGSLVFFNEPREKDNHLYDILIMYWSLDVLLHENFIGAFTSPMTEMIFLHWTVLVLWYELLKKMTWPSNFDLEKRNPWFYDEEGN